MRPPTFFKICLYPPSSSSFMQYRLILAIILGLKSWQPGIQASRHPGYSMYQSYSGVPYSSLFSASLNSVPACAVRWCAFCMVNRCLCGCFVRVSFCICGAGRSGEAMHVRFCCLVVRVLSYCLWFLVRAMHAIYVQVTDGFYELPE